MVALYVMQRWSVRRLYPRVPLFPLLIFLRMSYVSLMSPFAPQAFVWTNADFILMCLALQALALLLPIRHATQSGVQESATAAEAS
jgi:hypothetical protein